ncbi:SAM-dependent methyltransferase [Alcaligenaceae bacterium]|nr:SAM-dependent methyltransferase [Alcaligenaceae bacterium]
MQRVAIPGGEDLLIRSLLDRQQYYDPTGAAGRLGICSASWPLFGLLWPSSIQMARRLLRRPVRPEERILEIGCGLALPTLVGRRRGARVTASDRHPLARSFLETNASINKVSIIKYRHGQWGGDGAARARDAGAEPLSARYDLILGSDLLYDRNAPRELADFIDDHAESEAEVWIIDPNRGHRPAFVRHMEGVGFELAEQEHIEEAGAGPDGGAYKGRLLKFRRG